MTHIAEGCEVRERRNFHSSGSQMEGRSASTTGLIKTQPLGVSLEWGPGICISSTLSGDADMAGQTHPGNHTSRITVLQPGSMSAL